MDHDSLLRKQLVKLLSSGEAHADFEAAVKGLPAKLRGQIPEGAEHSPWMLLEHLRIAQWDILDFSRNPKYEALKWPEGYWPATAAPEHEKDWDESIESFRKDLKKFCDLIEDKSTDLYAKIPH